MNRKDRRGNKTTYLSGNTGIRLICEAVAVELLFYAMLAIFRSAFGWQLPIRALGKLQVAMLVSLVLFIVGVPATGKYQRVCKVVLEIGYPAALVLFGIFHRRKLTESGKMLFQAYLSYWNKQYGTNYMTGAGTEMRYTYMLAFLLAVVVLLILIIWIAIHTKRKTDNETNCMDGSTHKAVYAKTQSRKISDKLRLTIYLILFFLSLLAVGRLISIWIVFACVIAWAAAFDSKLFRNADYALLGTFTALFVFIGNLGRIPQFCSILQNLIQTREVIIAVAASQVMSNVPAAILLSGFTNNYRALIIGTNLGGLGTMIASMASLISFKYISREDASLRGKYFIWFTAANVILLVILLAAAKILGQL